MQIDSQQRETTCLCTTKKQRSFALLLCAASGFTFLSALLSPGVAIAVRRWFSNLQDSFTPLSLPLSARASNCRLDLLTCFPLPTSCSLISVFLLARSPYRRAGGRCRGRTHRPAHFCQRSAKSKLARVHDAALRASHVRRWYAHTRMYSACTSFSPCRH